MVVDGSTSKNDMICKALQWVCDQIGTDTELPLHGYIFKVKEIQNFIDTYY
jgi:hypothetical protein